MEYERTAILKLPEKMNQTEFDTWKESGGIDFIDMFFHCIHQKSVRPDGAPDDDSDGEQEALPDGGKPMTVSDDEIEHRISAARKQLRILKGKAEPEYPTAAGYLSGVLDDVDEAEEMLKKETPIDDDGEPLADGGSSMPKLTLEHLKELKEVDSRLGDMLSEMTGNELGSFADIYETEQSIPEAGNEIELGEGFSLPEAEYVELLGMLEQARAAAADDPVPLGVRNRLLMNFILANPEEYARVKAEEMERQREAEEAARQQMTEAMARQQTNERISDLSDAVDIEIDGDEEETDG